MAAWTKYIKNRIKKNKNFICFIGGPTGSGKSWTSLRIAEELEPGFPIEHVVFKPLELMKLVNSGKLKTGSVIVFEEAGVALSNRNWQGLVNKMLNYLFQTFRHKRFILIMNSPYMDFVDKATRKLVHAEFQVEYIDRDKSQTVIKPQLIQYNGRRDKFYFKYLRVVESGKGVKVVKRWGVKKPSKELIKAYEKKKKDYTSDLNEDIMKKLLAKEKKEEKVIREEWSCKECGHKWTPRAKTPSYCPRCQKRDIYTDKQPIQIN